MWDFVVDKVALGQVLSEYFGFPCQSSFHQLLQKLSSSIIWGLYNRPEVAAVPSGLSPTPLIIMEETNSLETRFKCAVGDNHLCTV
jgi:hypothetical protein